MMRTILTVFLCGLCVYCLLFNFSRSSDSRKKQESAPEKIAGHLGPNGKPNARMRRTGNSPLTWNVFGVLEPGLYAVGLSQKEM